MERTLWVILWDGSPLQAPWRWYLEGIAGTVSPCSCLGRKPAVFHLPNLQFPIILCPWPRHWPRYDWRKYQKCQLWGCARRCLCSASWRGSWGGYMIDIDWCLFGEVRSSSLRPLGPSPDDRKHHLWVTKQKSTVVIPYLFWSVSMYLSYTLQILGGSRHPHILPMVGHLGWLTWHRRPAPGRQRAGVFFFNDVGWVQSYQFPSTSTLTYIYIYYMGTYCI